MSRWPGLTGTQNALARRLRHSAALGAAVLVLTPALAHGQAIERHAPSPAEGRAAPILAPGASLDQEDDTPIGPELNALRVIGAAPPPNAPAPEAGVDVSSVARLADVRAEAEADLTPFLGRKLSRKLIAEIEATIARRYRKLGYPFVSLSTPEQDISDGALEVQVTEFTLGKVKARGAPPSVDSDLTQRVGLRPHDPINAAQLSDDLWWLNRYPFRSVQAIFTPSETPGETDIILAATLTKPWQVYVGYDNSGSPSSSFDRYFVGGVVGGVFGRDSVLSVQGTGSRDAFGPGAEHPKYVSGALFYTLPIARHAQVEASYNHVETNQPSQAFQIRLKTDEGSLGVRLGVASFFDATTNSDIRVGVTAKHQEAITLFGGVNVYDVPVEDYALFAGYRLQQQAQASYSAFDIALHAAPGGLGRGNSDAQERLFSQGRANRAKYAYVTLTVNRTQSIGWGIDWRAEFDGQWSPQALPRTEQGGLGGESLVRGHTLDAGAFDTTAILRNEIRTTLPLAKVGQISPFAFADVGHGRDMHLKANTDVSSAGAGADVGLTSHSTFKVTLARLLRSSGPAHADDWKVAVAVNLRY